MEESPPGVQLQNAKGKVFSDGKDKAPVRQVGKTGNTKALNDFELAKYQYCGRDSDCVVSINGCCDCANGGIEVSVNKDRVESFRSRFDCLHVACTRRAASPPCQSGVVSCVSHRCQYFDDRATAAKAAGESGAQQAGESQ